MDNVILIGGGGHCSSIIDTIRYGNRFNIIGIIDAESIVGTYVEGIKVIGTDKELIKFIDKKTKVFISIGSIGNPEIRIDVYKRCKELGLELATIIDKTAIISSSIDNIGEGTFIGKGAIINTNVQIGKNVIINTGAIIDHDCKIEDFVHIAPASTLSGNVFVGKNSHIGTNSTIIQNINIGANTLIGAGSVVVKDVKQNKKAYGVPCREVL